MVRGAAQLEDGQLALLLTPLHHGMELQLEGEGYRLEWITIG
jgi:hypothetical protein